MSFISEEEIKIFSDEEKGTYCMIPLIQHFWNDKTIEIEMRLVVVGD